MVYSSLCLGFVVSLQELTEFIQELDGEMGLLEKRCNSLQDQAMLVLLQNKGTGSVSISRKRGRTDRVMTESEQTIFDGAFSSFIERIAFGSNGASEGGGNSDGESNEPDAVSSEGEDGDVLSENSQHEEENDEDWGDLDEDSDELEELINKATRLMKEACTLFKLPVIRVVDYTINQRRHLGSRCR
jgi:cobalamin biosynthesis protein CobT